MMVEPGETRSWIEEYILKHGGVPARGRQTRKTLLAYQQEFETCHSGRSFVECLDRTDFLQHWARHRNWKGRPLNGPRLELIQLRCFTRWLLLSGRTDDDVHHYVRPRSEAVLRGEVPELWLRHNLQRDIVEFRATLSLLDRCHQITAVQAAHSWNTHLNRQQSDRETAAIDEDLLVSWLGALPHQAPSLRRAADLLKGLNRFFDYLVSRGRLPGNLAAEVIARDSRHSAFRVLRVVARAASSDPVVVQSCLCQLDRFQSGLKAHFQAYLGYLESRKMVVESSLYALGRFDRILRSLDVEHPGDVSAQAIDLFLNENGVGPATRNQRLVRLRGFFRFLSRRGVKLGVAWKRWRRVPVPAFHPHIYTLKEIGSLLRCLQRHAARFRDPLRWQGMELVLFLCYASGLRVSEPLSLRVKDVQVDRGLLFIARTKFHKERWVPYGCGAERRILSYRRRRTQRFPERGHPEEPFFLTPSGQPLTRSWVGQKFREIIDEELELGGRGSRSPRIHDLRHAFAVHRLYKWYGEGADVQNKLPLLSAYMGHVHIRHTEVYLHLAEDLLRQAGRGFERLFHDAVDRPETDR